MNVIKKVITELFVILLLVGCSSIDVIDTNISLESDYDIDKSGEVEAQNTDNNIPAQDKSNASLDSLKDEGFVVIDEYSIDTEFENWGKVKLISGYNLVDNLPQLRFYLFGEDDMLLYEFEEFEDYKSIYNNLISVSAIDINHDGLKDLVILGEFMMGHGAESGKLFPLVNIYFQFGNEFQAKPDVNEAINSTRSINNIDKVVEYFKVNDYDWNN